MLRIWPMNRKKIRCGKVIIPADARPWPHERKVAKILSRAGYNIEFIPETSIKTPDIYIEHTAYEIKSPVSNKIDAVERNVTKALAKTSNVVFDGSRMKIRDDQITRELIKLRRWGKGLRKILFIDKSGAIIDISKFI